MRQAATFLCYLLASLAVSCTLHQPVAETIFAADAANDAIFKAVRLVVTDVLSGRHKFGVDARREAFSAIARLKMDALLPSVRQVARLPLSGRDSDALADVVAVAGALDALVVLHDRAAAELNVLRVSEVPLRGFAIQNLLTLRAWDATAAIEQELNRMSFSAVNGREAVMMLQFLAASPATSDRACPGADKILAAYACARDTTDESLSFCADLQQVLPKVRTRTCQKTLEHR